jgi:hypothetical protein
LRELAAWYRSFAERAENPTIWEARLRTAEALEADVERIERRNPGVIQVNGPSRRSSDLSRHLDATAMTYTVELRSIGGDLADLMREMRIWLDRNGIEAQEFHHSSAPPGLAFRIQFNDQAGGSIFAGFWRTGRRRRSARRGNRLDDPSLAADDTSPVNFGSAIGALATMI